MYIFMSKCHKKTIGIQFEDTYIKKNIKVMRKIYLLDLFDLFSKENLFENIMSNNSPKENDPNWNKTVEEFENNGFVTKKETWISSDGTSKYVKTYTESKKNVDVKELESALKIAVEKEEFEKAAELRDQIKKLKK